jgi:hypothetical protein
MRRLARQLTVALALAGALARGLLAPASAGSTTEAKQAEKKWIPPAIQAVCVEAPPDVDGKLDEACWQKASRLEGFFAPSVDQAPPEETTGLICVDEAAIYVGFICKDRTPEDIRATETRRNGEIWGDDAVEFDLDPWHQHQESYCFLVTARGTQSEGIPGGSATKIEWRGDWTAAASRTPDGWQAELAIPFSILRYPPGQTTFGFAIFRGFSKERIWVAWPIMEGREFNPQQAADLVGLHPPVQRPRPVLMPYVTADVGDFVGRRFDTGLDVQYRMPSGLTALATLNPDFKQIEDIVEPISFSYTERYLPDRRPFFITGQEGFFPREHLLYTRRIRDFDAGLKLFGKLGPDTIGILDAITYGSENSFAAKWGHDLDPDFRGNLLLVSHRKAGEPHNLAYGLDAGRVKRCPDGGDNLWVVLYQSQTQGKASGGSYGIGGEHWRGTGQLHWDWMFREVTADFDPVLGYYTSQNSIGGAFSLGKAQYYEHGAIRDQGWNVGVSHFPRLDGSGMLESSLRPSRFWEWRSGRYVNVGLDLAREYNQDSSDVFTSLGWNQTDMYRNGRVFALRGVRAGGDYSYYSLGQGFRPQRCLSVRVNAEYSHLEPPSEEAGHNYQTVMTASYDLTPEKCLAARAIWRDAGFSAYASYRQVVRRGMDAYVIGGDPDPARTGFAGRVAVKLIWVW